MISRGLLIRGHGMRYIIAICFMVFSFEVDAVELPVIDMHLHALAADDQGPPPIAICTPIDPFPAWDPAQPYGATFMAMLKEASSITAMERSITPGHTI